jgi:hypothetical protein
MPKLIEYKDMSPRAKAVVEGIAQTRGIDPADINNVWKALARHSSVMERFAAEMKAVFAPASSPPPALRATSPTKWGRWGGGISRSASPISATIAWPRTAPWRAGGT